MTVTYPDCRVCAEPTSEHCRAECYACGAPFHLALRQDIPGKDCGNVWLDEDHLALEFACNNCLGAGAMESTAPAAVPVAREPQAPPSPAAASVAVPGKRRYVRHSGMRANLVARTRRPRE